MEAATFVARYLKAAGVKRAFGLPGGEVLALVEGLRAAGVDVILTHHEGQAAMMAEATGWLTDLPGVCFSTLGPGASNLVSGVANAFLDRAPLLAFSGDHSDAFKPRNTHQQLDLVELFAPITRFAGELSAENALDLLTRLFDVATGTTPVGQPGPVYLTVANEELRLTVADPAMAERHVERAGNRWRASSSIRFGDERDPFERAAMTVDASQRPVIVAGIQVVQYSVERQLRELAERINAPLLVTPQAKGSLPEDHALFAGTFGAFGQPAIDSLLQSSDLAIMAGVDGVDFITPWPTKPPALSITGVPERRRTFQPIFEVAQSPLALDRLTARCRPKPAWLDVEGHRRRLAAGIHLGWSAGTFQADTGSMSPQTVLKALRETLPADGILTCDVGSHKLQACQQWQTLAPKTFLTSNGLSSMGYAIPAAVAAKLELPDRHVAAILGDGGLLMYAGELETVARLGLPLTLVVLVDQSLSLIKLKQERDALPIHAVDFGPVDYAGLAQDLGLNGRRCPTYEDLSSALRAASRADRATLIEVPIDMGWYRPPTGQAALDVG